MQKRSGRHQIHSLRLRRLFSLFRCFFSRFLDAFRAWITYFFVLLVERTIKLPVANWTTKLLKFSKINIIPLKSAILKFFRFQDFRRFSRLHDNKAPKRPISKRFRQRKRIVRIVSTIWNVFASWRRFHPFSCKQNVKTILSETRYNPKRSKTLPCAHSLRPRTHGNVFLRFCIVSSNELVVLDSLENSKQYKNAGKRFRVYGALVKSAVDEPDLEV